MLVLATCSRRSCRPLACRRMRHLTSDRRLCAFCPASQRSDKHGGDWAGAGGAAAGRARAVAEPRAGARGGAGLGVLRRSTRVAHASLRLPLLHLPPPPLDHRPPSCVPQAIALAGAGSLGGRLQQLVELRAVHASAGDLAPLHALCADARALRDSGVAERHCSRLPQRSVRSGLADRAHTQCCRHLANTVHHLQHATLPLPHPPCRPPQPWPRRCR